jgi:carnitine O-acetyltransferase
MLIQLWKEANERPEAFMDHAGVLRDARTGKAISAEDEGDGDNEGANGGARDEEMREFWVYSVMKRSVAGDEVEEGSSRITDDRLQMISATA